MVNDNKGSYNFKPDDFVVYPTHGVGRVVSIEENEIAGEKIELIVVSFEQEKMTLRVPTFKLQSSGMRPLAHKNDVADALVVLKGKARVKRTMWSRRAQEYESKINSGSLTSLAEVIRDLYKGASNNEQSYSERQLYEMAYQRLSREIAAVSNVDSETASSMIDGELAKKIAA
ncbi:MAG: CarD family transcriptional regulator [Pseudomonadota bacterium]